MLDNAIGLVNPTQSAPGETIEAADINTPVNQLAAVINGSIEAANLASSAVTTAKIADGTVTNAKLSTTAGELGGAYTSWTPTFVNLSGGTLNYSKYTQVGKTVYYIWKYTLAGAGVAGAVTFTLPVTAHADEVTATIGGNSQGVVRLDDTGTNSVYGTVDFTSTTVARVLVWTAGSTYLQNTVLSSTVPHTWASTDIIYVKGSYIAA